MPVARVRETVAHCLARLFTRYRPQLSSFAVRSDITRLFCQHLQHAHRDFDCDQFSRLVENGLRRIEEYRQGEQRALPFPERHILDPEWRERSTFKEALAGMFGRRR
jgi:hypothetical protein